MARIFIPKTQLTGEQIPLQGRQVRYLLTVLRLTPGDEVIVFDGEGGEYHAVLCEEEQQGVYLWLREAYSPKRESPLRLTLAQAVLKGEKMKFVIQKATELGVHRIVPLMTSRTIPVMEGERESLRVQRWQNIAQEAAKQSGRVVVPEIERICELSEYLSQGRGLRIMLWEGEPTPLKEVVGGINEPPQEVTLLVGPEGGFSEQEVIEAQREGFFVAGLGRRILRAETAAISVLAIIQYQFGDLG